MEQQEQAAGLTGAAETTEMGFAQRLSGIYFEPRKTFESINRRPTRLGIYVLAAVLGAGMMYTLTARMDYQTYMRKAMKMNPLTRNMPEAQVEAIVSRPPSAFQRYSQIITAPLAILVSYLVLAGVFLLVFILMGAGIPYKKALAATVWGMAPPGIIMTLLSILFMMIKDPQTLDVNPAGNVVSNPGSLVSATEHPGLASLLSSIDIFSFWTIYLLAVGFAVCSGRKLTAGKAGTAIVVLWLLYVAGKSWMMS